MENWSVVHLIVLFPLLWCGVSFLLAHLSGWSRLAARFRTADEPKGRPLFMQPGRIGMVRYTRCLTLHLAEGGMYLAVFPLCRPGHPRLFIPWAEFNNLRQTRSMFFDCVEATIGRPPITKVLLPPNVFPPELLKELRRDEKAVGELKKTQS